MAIERIAKSLKSDLNRLWTGLASGVKPRAGNSILVVNSAPLSTLNTENKIGLAP